MRSESNENPADGTVAERVRTAVKHLLILETENALNLDIKGKLHMMQMLYYRTVQLSTEWQSLSYQLPETPLQVNWVQRLVKALTF